MCYLPRRRLSMSLKSLPIPPVPEETARVAHAVFLHGNVFMQVRDTLGTIYTDEAFADLFPTHGQPALAPWRLALVTVFQFMEGLTDRQAAEAVGDRLAWTIPCFPNFARVWLREMLNSVCWICSWSAAEKVGGSKPEGDNAPTRPM